MLGELVSKGWAIAEMLDIFNTFSKKWDKEGKGGSFYSKTLQAYVTTAPLQSRRRGIFVSLHFKYKSEYSIGL